MGNSKPLNVITHGEYIDANQARSKTDLSLKQKDRSADTIKNINQKIHDATQKGCFETSVAIDYKDDEELYNKVRSYFIKLGFTIYPNVNSITISWYRPIN